MNKKNIELNVLVACEESQAVMKAFRKLTIKGVKIKAYSCDLLECSGGQPQHHFKQDVFKIIKNKGGITQGKIKVDVPRWDLMIAHPPCTYLAVSGARWFYDPADKDKPVDQRRPHPKYPNRRKDQKEAIKFFMNLWQVKDIQHIAIENPIGIMSKHVGIRPQIVQPFHFGDAARKTTCLWLKNLPNLEKTKVVDEGERVYFKSGKSQPKWYSDAFSKAKTAEERRTLRSKTFPGMAKAMAMQWSQYLLSIR